MRNEKEARIFVRDDVLVKLKSLSTEHGVGLTEMVRILINNSADRAGEVNGIRTR